MSYSRILSTTVFTQMVRKIKHGCGEKTTVKLVCANSDGPCNRSEIRIVFHNNKVYFAKVNYNELWVRDSWCRGHIEKSNYSKPIKSQHDFDLHVFGYNYKGSSLDELAWVDMALKMYANAYLDTINGRLYLKQY